MAKEYKNFYRRISEANVLPDGMLSEVNYGDYALMMVAKDKPIESKHSHKHEDITSLE